MLKSKPKIEIEDSTLYIGTKVFVLDKSTASRLIHRDFKLVCRYCGEPLKIGDVVVSKITAGGVRRHHYHKECYEKTFVNC